MGFGQETNRNATFVNIVGGKFAVKCNEDTPNAVSRKNKKSNFNNIFLCGKNHYFNLTILRFKYLQQKREKF